VPSVFLIHFTAGLGFFPITKSEGEELRRMNSEDIIIVVTCLLAMCREDNVIMFYGVPVRTVFILFQRNY